MNLSRGWEPELDTAWRLLVGCAVLWQTVMDPGEPGRRTEKPDRAGDPPETDTRQDFQGIVRGVRRLKTAQSGCEDRLEKLEAWQDHQVNVHPTNARINGPRIDDTYLPPVHF